MLYLDRVVLLDFLYQTAELVDALLWEFPKRSGLGTMIQEKRFRQSHLFHLLSTPQFGLETLHQGSQVFKIQK